MAADPYRYFRIEARELLDQLYAGVLELEKGEIAGIAASLLRLAHTLKGAAHVVKLGDVANLAHEVESALAPYREMSDQGNKDGQGGKDVSIDRACIDGILSCLDSISGHIENLPAAEPAAASASALTSTPASASAPASAPTPTLPSIPEPPVRVARSDIAVIDALLEGLGELSSDLASMQRTVASIGRAHVLAASAERGLVSGIERIGRELHQVRETAERLRLTPVANIFNTLERSARDAAHSVGKQVHFTARGGEVRLDGQVLDTVQSALIQLVRNAIAHGIEREADRLAANKPPTGCITLDVTRRGCEVSFRCTDDGRGIDLEAVRRAMQNKGIYPAGAERLDTAELLTLLFKGGISTASTITELAGRGVGMDVVREAMQHLNGKVSAQTTSGKGTAIELLVPVSLASVEALIADMGGQIAAIPLDAVRCTVRAAVKDVVHTSEGDAILHEDKLVKLVTPALENTHNAHNVHNGHKKSPMISAAIVTATVAEADTEAAVIVDRLHGVEMIVLQPLPSLAPSEPIVAGAYLDPNGTPRLVLSPEALTRAAQQSRPEASLAAALHSSSNFDPIPILIIDDSLTTRMLETSILESAGFITETASSAEEGWDMARRKKYALFLVDVEMPGMDGFTFVERTRADAVLRDVPCILVSSRDAPEDRQRGETAGAVAYITKGDFNQNDFLQRVGQLVQR